MEGIVFERHGGTEVLERRALPPPDDVGPDEVLLRVRATGLNYSDVWARRGMTGVEIPMPHISGCEAAGLVERVGSAVRNVAIGDQVVVNSGFACGTCIACQRGQPFVCPSYRIWGFQTGPYKGAQVELASVPARNLLPRPRNLTWEEAGSITLSLVTAWRALVTRAGIAPGDFVLVWGGAGGVGSMAIQLCRLFGARAIAVASGAERLRFCKQLGAEFTIDRQTQRVAREVQRITDRKGVQVVLDHAGEATWQVNTIVLAWGGTIVSCGVTTGFRPAIDLRYLTTKQQSYLGSFYGTTAELADALRFVCSGAIRPVVMDVLPLHEVAHAHEILEGGDVRGKLVLVP